MWTECPLGRVKVFRGVAIDGLLDESSPSLSLSTCNLPGSGGVSVSAPCVPCPVFRRFACGSMVSIPGVVFHTPKATRHFSARIICVFSVVGI